MFGQYDQVPGFYDEKRGVPLLDHEFSRRTPVSEFISAGMEHHAQLLAEAELERRARGFAPDNSRAGRVILDVGSLFVRLGCRLEKYGFSQFRSPATAAAVAVDCGCA
jgi:hypothetical protein